MLYQCVRASSRLTRQPVQVIDRKCTCDQLFVSSFCSRQIAGAGRTNLLPRAFKRGLASGGNSGRKTGSSGAIGGSSFFPLVAVGGVGVLGLTLLADRLDGGMQQPNAGLGAGMAHGTLGERFEIEANGVRLQFAPEMGAATADADVGGEGVWTGRFLWASGGELAKFIVGKGPEYWAEKRVLELGCGCGLAGLTAAAMGAKEIVLTDQVTDGAASNLAANVAAAPDLGGRCRVSKLSWGAKEDYASVGALPFDVIVGSDIMQEGGDIVGDYKTLADTVAAMSGPKTEFWLCNAIANPLKLAEFFSAMKQHGFKSKVVKPPIGFDPIAVVLFFRPEPEAGGDAPA